MTERILIVALVALVGSGLVLSAAGALSGSAQLGIVVNSTRWFDDMSLDVAVDYALEGLTLSSESLIVYPTTWVWQAFAADAQFGGYGLTTHVLFGASTAEYLFAEMIVTIPIAGIDFAFHAAQLSSAVVGGPEEGWALRISGNAGPFDLISVTEFGAQIEDEDNSGITIIHAPTGQTHHYVTDPRVAGVGFTGQKIGIEHLDFCCSDLLAVELYFTCEGFDYLELGVAGLEPGLPWVILDVDVTFTVDEKTLMFTPGFVLGDVACFDLYAELDVDGGGTLVDGISVYGAELICELGSATVRDVVVFDLTEHVITTEDFGSKVEKLTAAVANRHEFYPDYWQLLSIAYSGEGCCGSPLSVLVNTYFGESSANLFDVGMVHAEASIPLAESLTFTLSADFEYPSIWSLSFSFDIAW
jgi:hypothetical protein